MNDNTKLEVAIEIIASKIAQMVQNGYNEDSQEIKQLLWEKKELYNFNIEIINKIINIYGKEIRNKYEK